MKNNFYIVIEHSYFPYFGFQNLAGRNVEVTRKMKLLMQQITRQRMLIMRCLETDIDSNQINKHISVSIIGSSSFY